MANPQMADTDVTVRGYVGNRKEFYHQLVLVDAVKYSIELPQPIRRPTSICISPMKTATSCMKMRAQKLTQPSGLPQPSMPSTICTSNRLPAAQITRLQSPSSSLQRHHTSDCIVAGVVSACWCDRTPRRNA